jgi:hypothetical protein
MKTFTKTYTVRVTVSSHRQSAIEEEFERRLNRCARGIVEDWIRECKWDRKGDAFVKDSTDTTSEVDDGTY